MHLIWLYVADWSSTDFMAAAKRLQQDYLNRSTASTEHLASEPIAAVMSTGEPHPSCDQSSINSHPATAENSAPRPDPVVMSVPDNANAVEVATSCAGAVGPSEVPVVHSVPHQSTVAKDSEATPVRTTLRSVTRQQQEASTSSAAAVGPPKEPVVHAAPPPSTSARDLEAVPVHSTLRSVNKQQQANSMVFRALARPARGPTPAGVGQDSRL